MRALIKQGSYPDNYNGNSFTSTQFRKWSGLVDGVEETRHVHQIYHIAFFFRQARNNCVSHAFFSSDIGQCLKGLAEFAGLEVVMQGATTVEKISPWSHLSRFFGDEEEEEQSLTISLLPNTKCVAHLPVTGDIPSDSPCGLNSFCKTLTTTCETMVCDVCTYAYHRSCAEEDNHCGCLFIQECCDQL